MSELITTPPGGTFPAFGLEVISQGPVRLFRADDGSGPVSAFGSSLDDLIRALDPLSTALSFFLEGGDGDDFLVGAGGNDTIEGDSGSGDDFIQGLGGDDLLSGGNGDDFILGDAGNDVMLGEAGDDIVSGGDGNDVIYGGADEDDLSGGAGDDIIFGGSGDDTIFGGTENDRLFGQRGADSISGDAGDDIIFGGAGNDTLKGGEGNDRIVANAGDDIIIGGPGDDILTGGKGADRFEFGRRAGVDQITDFSAQDTIALAKSMLPGSKLPLGRLSASDFQVVNTLNNNTTAKIIYEQSTGFVYYKPSTGTDVPLVKLPDYLTISASNFEITNG